MPKKDAPSNKLSFSPQSEKREIAIDLHKTKVNAYGLQKGLSEEQLAGLEFEIQVDGILLGFSKEDVISDWFSFRHLKAAREGIALEGLRHKTVVGVYGLQKGLSEAQVEGITTVTQIDGILTGFSKEDVMSDWFSAHHLLLAQKGISLESLREKKISGFFNFQQAPNEKIKLEAKIGNTKIELEENFDTVELPEEMMFSSTQKENENESTNDRLNIGVYSNKNTGACMFYLFQPPELVNKITHKQHSPETPKKGM